MKGLSFSALIIVVVKFLQTLLIKITHASIIKEFGNLGPIMYLPYPLLSLGLLA